MPVSERSLQQDIRTKRSHVYLLRRLLLTAPFRALYSTASALPTRHRQHAPDICSHIAYSQLRRGSAMCRMSQGWESTTSNITVSLWLAKSCSPQRVVLLIGLAQPIRNCDVRGFRLSALSLSGEIRQITARSLSCTVRLSRLTDRWHAYMPVSTYFKRLFVHLQRRSSDVDHVD